MGDPSRNASGTWGISCLLVLFGLMAVPTAIVIGLMALVNSI